MFEGELKANLTAHLNCVECLVRLLSFLLLLLLLLLLLCRLMRCLVVERGETSLVEADDVM
ncbi:MAG: hypothetical protein V3R25_09040 [Nitrosomonadaceae bacterium]